VWDGHRWTWSARPTFNAGGGVLLDCSSATSCLVTRFDEMWRWDGRRWTAEERPRWHGRPLQIHAVACPDEHRCVVSGIVGVRTEAETGTEGGEQAAMAAVVGHDAERLPPAADRTIGTTHVLDCAGDRCLAARGSADLVRGPAGEPAHWEPIPPPPVGGAVLAVACRPDWCMAVGSYSGPLAARYRFR
jgi:hypothetical protein